MKSYMSYAVVTFLLVVMGLLVTCLKGQEKSEGITLQVFAYLDRTDTAPLDIVWKMLTIKV